jgi:hypothetical protein
MKFLATLSLALLTSVASAQSDAVFHSVGWTVYLDYMKAPAYSYPVELSNGEIGESYDQSSGISLFTFLYNFRYNVKELSDDAVISLSATPAFGLYTEVSDNQSGVGHINLPIALGWEYGAGSTYNSAKSKGTFIRAGWEFTHAPLFGFEEIENRDIKKSWGALSLQTGLRYYNRKNRMRELNLKYARGSSEFERQAWAIRFAWVFILNY